MVALMVAALVLCAAPAQAATIDSALYSYSTYTLQAPVPNGVSLPDGRTAAGSS
jgi:hypothetical protein